MRIALRLLTAAAMLASAAYGLPQLREVARVKAALSQAQDPAQALAALSAMQGSSAVQELVAAQAAQLARLSEAGADGAPAPRSPAPEAEPEPPLPSDSRQRVFSASTAGVIRLKPGEAPPPGAALLVDHKTGERLAMVKTKRPAGDGPAAVFPQLPLPVANALSDDLASRRNRAYAALLATAAFAFFLVWRVRRGILGA